MSIEHSPARNILRHAEVCKMLGVGRVTVWRLVKQGKLAPPLQIASNRIGWFEDEVADYQASIPRVAYVQPEEVA